jgi:hypothetical protein
MLRPPVIAVIILVAMLIPLTASAAKHVGVSQQKPGNSFAGTVVGFRSEDGKKRYYVLTCAHAIEDESQPVVIHPVKQKLDVFEAAVLAIDRDRDLALTEYPPDLGWAPGDRPTPLADECPEPGAEIRICGYGNQQYNERPGKITKRETVTIIYDDEQKAVRTLPGISVAGREGDSGGAIMHKGKLVGVNIAGGTLKQTTKSHFVPVEEVHEFLKENGFE